MLAFLLCTLQSVGVPPGSVFSADQCCDQLHAILLSCLSERSLTHAVNDRTRCCVAQAVQLLYSSLTTRYALERVTA
jgi:hypothetical protein